MSADPTDGELRRLRLSRRGRRAPLVAALACLAIASLAGLASATTGPGYLLQVPRYRIALSTIKHYLGRYTTTSSARASKIVSSEVIITFAESGYPAGGISIYSYDAAGQEQSFAGTLYDFHQVGGQIDADIVTVGGGAIIGHLSVRHAGSTRNLVGTIDPPGGGGPFAISYRYAASAGPVPGQAYSPLPVPGPPNAGTVSGAALGQPGTTPPATAPKRGPALKPGWGSLTSFLGRYHVLPGPTAAPTPVQEGIFTVAVSDANRISAASLEPTGGELTLFLRKAKVKTTVELLPSGILSIRTPAGNYVLYLTMLESAGTRRAATVNQGAFVGAPLGTLTGTNGAGGTLTATVAATGVGKISARFVRFSANPQP